MSEIKLNINGIPVVGQAGETVLKIARDNGIEIPTLCHHETVAAYGACGLCVVEIEGIKKLLRSCTTVASDGMVVITDSPKIKQSRKIALELLMSDHEGDCRGPCKLNCPAGTDCQEYVKQIAAAEYHEAVKIVKEKVPLPASIGRVCPHPCETACRRKYVEEPLSLAHLKQFAADRDLESDTYRPEVAPETGKSVAIIGGGPGGLTAAFYLRQKGHSVTIYDAMPKMGGMLRYGIPAYRLPKNVLDREIEEISALGVKLINNVKIGRDMSLDEIRTGYDATLVAIGAWSSTGMRCPGEELDGVVGGIDFLREVSLYNSGERENAPEIGDRVAVVGGGNTAMDACRTAVRLGAKEVYIIYRRTRAEMPAEDIEILEAEEEGVIYKFLTNPEEIIGENGKVKQIKLQIMELGEPDASGRRAPVPVEGKFEYLDVDTVIAAIGQRVDTAGFEAIEKNNRGILAADEASYLTNLEGVFAIGDATNKGASIAIEAIGEGNRAAKVIDSYLNGAILPYCKPYYSETVFDPEKVAHRENVARARMPHRKPEERKNDFLEVNLGLDEKMAQIEAARCLECGCHDYFECDLIRSARRQEINPARLAGEKNIHPTERELTVIERDPGKCILCALCVRTCNENAKEGLLGIMNRGFSSEINPVYESIRATDVCRDCLKCVEVCPTGALRYIKK